MPEITELHNFFHYLSQMIHLYLSGLPVLAIWADLTVEENTRLNGNGKPVILDHLCGFTRGSGNQRGPLWPPEHLVPALSECSSSDAFQKSQLKIIGVEWHPRRVVLNLNSVYLSIQVLQHTSPQVYTKTDWIKSIIRVPASIRTSRIAIALDFGPYILAFVSRDSLFTPIWHATHTDIPNSIKDYYGWLETVVQWITVHWKTNDQMICTFLRNSEEELAFAGIGVYTCPELLFIAGISPFLMVKNILTCPPRMARLCEALYCFMNRPFVNLSRSFKRHKCTLNASVQERLKYSERLHVHAKSQTLLSERLFNLIQVHNDISKTCHVFNRNDRFDPYEPTYSKDSFTSPEHLSHLILGDKLYNQHYSDRIVPNDPLSKFYHSGVIPHSLLDWNTHLNCDLYDTLFTPCGVKRMSSICYEIKGDQFWSLHIIPTDLKESKRKMIKSTSEKVKRGKLMTNIKLHSMNYTVGPLDFVGVADVITVGLKQYVGLCFGDPQMSEWHRLRLRRSAETRNKWKPGKLKARLTNSQRLRLHEVQKKLRMHKTIAKAKALLRRRQSVDHHMVNDVSNTGHRFRRSCSHCHNLALEINAEKEDDTDWLVGID